MALIFFEFKDSRALAELIDPLNGLIFRNWNKNSKSLTEELERAQAEVAEIESDDQDNLNELKATVAEQK